MYASLDEQPLLLFCSYVDQNENDKKSLLELLVKMEDKIKRVDMCASIATQELRWIGRAPTGCSFTTARYNNKSAINKFPISHIEIRPDEDEVEVSVLFDISGQWIRGCTGCLEAQASKAEEGFHYTVFLLPVAVSNDLKLTDKYACMVVN